MVSFSSCLKKEFSLLKYKQARIKIESPEAYLRYLNYSTSTDSTGGKSFNFSEQFQQFQRYPAQTPTQYPPNTNNSNQYPQNNQYPDTNPSIMQYPPGGQYPSEALFHPSDTNIAGCSGQSKYLDQVIFPPEVSATANMLKRICLLLNFF